VHRSGVGGVVGHNITLSAGVSTVTVLEAVKWNEWDPAPSAAAIGASATSWTSTTAATSATRSWTTPTHCVASKSEVGESILHGVGNHYLQRCVGNWWGSNYWSDRDGKDLCDCARKQRVALGNEIGCL
jgi:hypothetical protein